jgi:Ca2+-binding RTX toxin-like protein
MYLQGKAGKDVLKGGAGDDQIYGLGGDDTLTGAGGADLLVGDAGNDSLSGGAQDDYLMGGAGNDLIDGGSGVDWSSYEDVAAAVKVDLSLTVAQNTSGGGTDRLTGIENLYGSAFNDTLIGDTGLNYLSGGAGHDSIFGGAGDDHLEGGAGDDQIDGGAGFDVASFDDGIAVGVSIYLGSPEYPGISNGYAHGHGNDVLIGIEDVWATQYDDRVQGNSNDNAIFGRDGNDTLSGGWGGSDYLDGGAGDDRFLVDYYGPTSLPSHHVQIDGGDGFDTLSMDDFDVVGVTIDLAITGRQYFDADNSVTLNSIESIISGTGGDTFYASAARNVFGLQAHWEGPDRVIFRSLAELGNGANADRIIGSGQIDVSAIDADVTTPGDQAFHFVTRWAPPTFPNTEPVEVIGNTAFTGKAGEMIHTLLAGDIQLIQFDVNGDKIADAALYFERGFGNFVF